MNETKKTGIFKSLNTGVKRLLFVLGIFISVILPPFALDNDFIAYVNYPFQAIVVISAFFILYCIVIWILLWIIEGFKK